MKIWKCPNCNAGVRAPGKLAKLDTRRWCLKCSARTGRLVERGLPSRETEKARRAEARKAQAAKRREGRAIREAAAKAHTVDLAASFDRHPSEAAAWLRAWIPRVVKLVTFREAFRENYVEVFRSFRDRRWDPQITIRQGRTVRELNITHERLAELMAKYPSHSRTTRPDGTADFYVGRQHASGHAWMLGHRCVVTTGATAADDLSTLIHELTHLAAPYRAHHGPAFVELQRRAVAELTGVAPQGWQRGEARGRVEVIQAWLDQQKLHDLDDLTYSNRANGGVE